MKKLIYIIVIYISSVNITGELFSSSTLIMFLGYYTAIENLIEQMKLTKTFQHKEYYSRLKSKYRKMAKQEIDNADVINEINTKVNDIVLMQEVS